MGNNETMCGKMGQRIWKVSYISSSFRDRVFQSRPSISAAFVLFPPISIEIFIIFLLHELLDRLFAFKESPLEECSK